MFELSQELILPIVILIISGVVAGIAAGMFGIGGGIILVAAITDVLMIMGTPPTVAVKTAVGTSLATVIITSLRSAQAHHKKGSFSKDAAMIWAPLIIIGAIAGTAVSTQGGRQLFQILFLVLGPLLACNMAFGRKDWSNIVIPSPNLLQPVTGVFVGFFSVMMGLGFGAMGIPALTLFGMDLRRAIGTAAILGLCTSVPGALGFIIMGYIDGVDIPGPSLGYFSVLAFLVVVPITFLLAPVGVWMNHKMPLNILRKAFAVLIIVNVLRVGLAI
ncbi:MAG: sulfite exporter TauE/SafE family protein [SAR116 cluster bacterium]|nr:hypothetical protein [Paracoccaceae bacterium]RCL81811.1 MAG: sulfite exporter TauE/SafE family protein [SAR116 cluster bacterium]RPH14507.1 MAG: sulfite exporter TauE/SafE family protein [Alphaproteobacteria bacterium TMED150]HBQ22914.1 hypothetical protein [Alphaproteobacteria bacterium]|tara:strand:- start:3029 stop:3850 length:822 start_codon:yes stop_codon:yes gene_type:complete